MDFFNTVTGIIITIAGALSAIVGIFAIVRKPFIRYREKKKARAEEIRKQTECQQDTKEKLCDITKSLDALTTVVDGILKENNAQNELFKQLIDENKSIKSTMDRNEIDRIRWEILEFANMCRRQQRTTKDEFIHIINLYHKYHELLIAQGQENGQITLEFEFISRLYMKLSETDGFTKD